MMRRRGGEQAKPPSSPGEEEVGGGVVTPEKITQTRWVGALTQTSIRAFLIPIRNEVLPRAENLPASPSNDVVVEPIALEATGLDGGGSSDVAGNDGGEYH